MAIYKSPVSSALNTFSVADTHAENDKANPQRDLANLDPSVAP